MSLCLIDLGRPVLMAHVPKTGGTSIRSGRMMSGIRMFDPDPMWPVQWTPSFGLVRDPRARVESCWKDFRHLRRFTRMSLEEFLTYMRLSMSHEGRVANPMTMEHHAAPMTHPVHGLRHVGNILRTERLQEDLDTFCEQYNLRTVKLRRLRDTSDCPKPDWTPRAVALFQEIYADDLQYMEGLK